MHGFHLTHGKETLKPVDGKKKQQASEEKVTTKKNDENRRRRKTERTAEEATKPAAFETQVAAA